MKTETDQTIQTANNYNFELLPADEIPTRPEKLFVPEQLETALNDAFELDNERIAVNTRFRTTVSRLNGNVIEISWEHFDEEDHYGGDGWAVVYSAAAIIAHR